MFSAFSSLFGSLFDSSSTSGPSCNIDGTPMMGSVDVNGNPYGVTSHDWSSSSCTSSSDTFSSSPFTSDSFGSSFSDNSFSSSSNWDC